MNSRTLWIGVAVVVVVVVVAAVLIYSGMTSAANKVAESNLEVSRQEGLRQAQAARDAARDAANAARRARSDCEFFAQGAAERQACLNP